MIKGAIFDLDGTLLDSMKVWDYADEMFLHQKGHRATEEFRETMKNVSILQAAQQIKETYHLTEDINEIMEGINETVKQFYLQEVELKPGVKEFLQQLKQHNIPATIATANDKRIVDAGLKHLGIRAYFLGIHTCTDVLAGKNEPLVYRAALTDLHTLPNETVVFEDAAYALKTARDDGFITVSLADASEPEQESVKEYSDLFLGSFEQADKFWEFFKTV